MSIDSLISFVKKEGAVFTQSHKVVGQDGHMLCTAVYLDGAMTLD